MFWVWVQVEVEVKVFGSGSGVWGLGSGWVFKSTFPPNQTPSYLLLSHLIAKKSARARPVPKWWSERAMDLSDRFQYGIRRQGGRAGYWQLAKASPNYMPPFILTHSACAVAM